MDSRIHCTELASTSQTPLPRKSPVASNTVVRTLTVLLAAAGLAVAAGVPQFEVDPGWPKVPAKWKLGDASSVAVDAKDNIWVLHRPRTRPQEPSAMAAPPVMVF